MSNYEWKPHSNSVSVPVITKVFKQGNPRPIKEYKGQTEVLGVIEVYEEMDAGTYVVEFTNPVYKLQDLTFIFK